MSGNLILTKLKNGKPFVNINNQQNLKDNNNNFKEIFDLETNFYWINYGQKYPVNTNLKYCIFFNGCCCPPHIGHINSIKDAISVFGPECKIIINHIGSSKRHGVPSKFSSYMFQKYLNDIFGTKSNIDYLFRAKNKNIFFHKKRAS